MGLTVAPLAQLTLEDVPADHAASGSGLFNTVAQLAASVGVAVFGTVFFARLSGPGGESVDRYANAFTTTIVGSLVLLAVTFGLSFVLPRREAASTPAPAPAETPVA
jgi:hypothetical protein